MPVINGPQPTANCPPAIPGHVSKPHSVRVQEKEKSVTPAAGLAGLHVTDQKASRPATALTAIGWKFKPEHLVLMLCSSQ